MHWCAVMGTRYTLNHLNSTGDMSSRNTTVIVTACLVSAVPRSPLAHNDLLTDI
jgi:hypothetical protein